MRFNRPCATKQRAMKTLVVLRHAKSSWDDSSQDDHARPLNKRGRRTAPLMGAHLRDLVIVPDRVVTSTAVRAMQTAELVAEAASLECEVIPESELYLAVPSVYVNLLAELPESIQCPMMVGHNPGIQELVGWLTGRDVVMPTAAVAVIDLEGDTWAQAAETAAGVLRHYQCPRDLVR